MAEKVERLDGEKQGEMQAGSTVSARGPYSSSYDNNTQWTRVPG